jgi:hypothetical protein
MFPIALIHAAAQKAAWPFVNLGRNSGLDPEARQVFDVFARYGTPEIYERSRQRMQSA